MRIVYHPDAEKELIEAAKAYERSVATLGDQFLDATDQAIAVILKGPERWRILDRDVRRYLMPVLPIRDLLQGAS